VQQPQAAPGMMQPLNTHTKQISAMDQTVQATFHLSDMFTNKTSHESNLQ